jgi:hypothetical protein
MVSATNSFTQHPAVINGCSELYAEVWGAENGVGVRSAVGVSSLPAGVAADSVQFKDCLDFNSNTRRK